MSDPDLCTSVCACWCMIAQKCDGRTKLNRLELQAEVPCEKPIRENENIEVCSVGCHCLQWQPPQPDHRWCLWKTSGKHLFFWKANVEASPERNNQFLLKEKVQREPKEEIYEWREREREDLVGVSEEVAEDRVRRSHVIDCGDLQREQPIGKNRRNITKRGRELNCMKCMIKHNITLAKNT